MVGGEIFVTGSIVIMIFPDDGNDASDSMRNAEGFGFQQIQHL